MAIIKVKNLSKTYSSFKRREGVLGGFKDLLFRDYQDIKAVDSIDLEVNEGELLGYIGPNGAGKSTSIKMLTGILKPSSGEIEVMGFHPFQDRKTYTQHIGVVFGQRTQLWWDIAVIESFNLLAKIYRVSKADYKKILDSLIGILDLKDILHQPVRKLSLGQRMRSDLAASLIHSPKLLFLDEPTIGLDAVAKDAIRSFLRRVNREFKTTIILTTHDLHEIEELCERIVVLDKGRILYDGGLDYLKNLSGLSRKIIIDFSGDAPLEQLKQSFNDKVSLHLETNRRVEASFSPQNISSVEVIKKLMSEHQVSDLSIVNPSIEEVIMKIYKDGISQ